MLHFYWVKTELQFSRGALVCLEFEFRSWPASKKYKGKPLRPEMGDTGIRLIRSDPKNSNLTLYRSFYVNLRGLDLSGKQCKSTSRVLYRGSLILNEELRRQSEMKDRLFMISSEFDYNKW